MLANKNQQIIVPLFETPSNSEHVMKYLVLNEAPTEYICEKGCVHKFESVYTVQRPIPTPWLNKDQSLLAQDMKLIETSPVMKQNIEKSPVFRRINIKAGGFESPRSRSPVWPKSASIFPATQELIQEIQNNSSIISKTHDEQRCSNISATRTNFRPRANSEERISSPRYDSNISNVFDRLYPYKKGDPRNSNPSAIKMDWKNYHRLETIYKFMDELETDYPSLCTVGVIGQSVEGRDLKILKISNGDAKNSSVWIDAGIHAREWIGPAVNTYIANYIVRNFDKLPNSCKNKDWYLMPVVNPDGYEYSHTKFRMWRKNRALFNNKCCGVDINRNFSVAWGGKGSSGEPDHSFFRGPEPFSEPEACAMKEVLLDANLQFKVYLTLHAFGEVIIMPYAHSDDLCDDYIRLLNGAVVMSRAIYDTDGTIYKVGVSKDVMYRASGTSNDWSYGAAGIPWCYLIELRSKKHKFKCPEEEINETGAEILNGVLALMSHVDKTALTQDTGDCTKGRKKDYTKQPTQVWEVRLVSEGHRQFIKALDTAGVVNIWKEEASIMEVMVVGPRIHQLSGLLNQREIPYSVAMPDVSALLRRERSVRSIQKGTRRMCVEKESTKMNWTTYHDLDSIYKFMEELSKAYPYLVTLFTIGKTFEGRRILVMKISNGSDGNPAVWVDGGIHPREWISVAVVTYLANNLVRTYKDQPPSVTSKDWYILPVMNPDGYAYTHTTDRLWRKNRARHGESIGVDLNRNFSEGFAENGEEGSSEEPGNIFYRGPEPFSEAETKAVKNLIENSGSSFQVFLSLHSFGEVIIFPWGYKDEPCESYVDLLEAGTAMAKAIFQKSGRTYKVGSTKDLMYYAAGTSIDWSYGARKIPYSYMIELPGKRHRFLLPQEEIIPTAEEVYSAIIKLMDFIDHRSKATQSVTIRSKL